MEVLKELLPGKTRLQLEFDGSSKTLDRAHVNDLQEFSQQVRIKYERAEISEREYQTRS